MGFSMSIRLSIHDGLPTRFFEQSSFRLQKLAATPISLTPVPPSRIFLKISKKLSLRKIML
jgi:hypothetical protein